MLLACSVNSPIQDNRFHLLALCCASRRVSCVDEASAAVEKTDVNPILEHFPKQHVVWH